MKKNDQFLNKIAATKREEVTEDKRRRSMADLEAMIAEQSFAAALKATTEMSRRPALIA